MIREETKTVPSGYMMIVVLLLLQGGALFLLVKAAMAQFPLAVVGCVLLNIVIGIMWAGFFMIHPNESVVLQLFGKYAGTAKEPGLKWANPFFSKKRVSARVRNFESGKLKVNDSQGSPIEIAAVVVWKVFDSAEAVFEVDNYEEFVTIQSESALRNLTTTYPYEANDGEKIALRSHPVEIANSLREEIQERLEQAGVSVIGSERSP